MRKILSMCLVALLALSFCVPAMAEASVYPLCENLGDVTLKVMVVAHPAIADWDTNDSTKWMEEQTNVKIEWLTVPYEGRAEAVQMALAGGEYPDVFMFPYGNCINQDILNRYGVNEKRLAVVDDLVKDFMPNLQKAYEDNPGYQGLMTMLDGHMYSLPTVNQCYHCTIATKMWINQQWLDNLGLAMPTTTDEFYDVLVAFRDNDPNGNGVQDEIPLAGAYINGWNTNSDLFIMNSFNYYTAWLSADGEPKSALGLYLDGDTVKVPFAEEGFKEGLKFMNKLVTEGLFYDGSFTMDQQALTNLVESPDAEMVGCVAGGYGGQFCNMEGERYEHYVALMPLTGPTGLQQIPVNNYDLGLSGALISDASPNKEIAAKWIDLLYTWEGSMITTFGLEDVAWRKATEGEVGLDDSPALFSMVKPWQEVEPQSDHWVQATVTYRNSAFRLGEAYDTSIPLYSGAGLEKLLYNVSRDMMQYADPAKYMPPVKFSTEDADAMSVPIVELSGVIKESLPQFMTGNLSIDDDFQSFLDNLNAAGLPALLEKYQAAYDAQFKK